VPGGDLAKVMRAVAMMSNSTAIGSGRQDITQPLALSASFLLSASSLTYALHTLQPSSTRASTTSST